MPYDLILGVLTVAGFVIGSALTLWGLTKKTTVEDAQGNKRLTPAGQVAVALAVCAFLVAVAAFGFRTLSDKAKAAATQAKEASDKEARARQDEFVRAQAFRQEERARREEEDRRLERAERSRAETEDRLFRLTTASAELQRDLRLAGAVDRGTALSLSKANAALAELARVLEPIQSIRFYFTRIDIPADDPDYRQWLAGIHPRIEEVTANFESPSFVDFRGGSFRRGPKGKYIPIEISIPEALWRNSRFGTKFGIARPRIAIFSEGVDISGFRPSIFSNTDNQDLDYFFMEAKGELFVSPMTADNWPRAEAWQSLSMESRDPNSWTASGKVISIPDIAGGSWSSPSGRLELGELTTLSSRPLGPVSRLRPSP